MWKVFCRRFADEDARHVRLEILCRDGGMPRLRRRERCGDRFVGDGCGGAVKGRGVGWGYAWIGHGKGAERRLDDGGIVASKLAGVPVGDAFLVMRVEGGCGREYKFCVGYIFGREGCGAHVHVGCGADRLCLY